MNGITSHTKKINSCDVHYLEAGNPQNKTVVLLHGMKFQAATWQEIGTLQKLVDAGFHAVAIDMPGFGKSPACSMEQDTVLEQFIHMAALHDIILAGPSMGGRIALEFTINHPVLISALVLIGAVGVAENKHNLGSIKAPTLIVWGSDDQISPLENSDILHKSIPDSKKIIIDGAPHPCYLDNPEKWHNSLIDFLNSVQD